MDTNGDTPDPEIKTLKLEINRLKADLQKHTENGEVMQLQARIEDLKGHNETLQKELEKAAQDKENLQNLYNNYILQVQSLINQKVIEAPRTETGCGKIRQYIRFQGKNITIDIVLALMPNSRVKK